jgi:hypothetical protein
MPATSPAPVLRNVVGAALIAAAGLFGHPESAAAASCSSLRADLAKVNSGKAASPGVAKWQTASRKQKKAIAAAERDARFFQCGKQGGTPKCQGLTAKIGKMQSNLRAIEKQLRRAERKSPDTSARKRSLKAALARQNCDASKKQRAAARNERTGSEDRRAGTGGPNFFQRLFGTSNGLEVANAGSGMSEVTSSERVTARTTRRRSGLPAGGTFRTLCVRTCDGYFFPVSFSTSRNQLPHDAARCGEMCPAAETELYVHRNPGERAADMTSLSGLPYAELPNAYRFKTEYVQGCSCRGPATERASGRLRLLTASDSETGGNDRVRVAAYIVGGKAVIRSSIGISEAGTPEQPRWTREPMRPDHVPPYTDPDTRHNQEMGFDPSAHTPSEATPASKENTAAGASGKKTLPVLTRNASSTRPIGPANSDPSTAAPVFGQDTATEAPLVDADARKKPIRVVGPEFFVAQ